METMQQGLERIAASVARRWGAFMVCAPPDGNGCALAVGSFRTTKIDGGFIVTIKLTRAQLQSLHNDTAELLKTVP